MHVPNAKIKIELVCDRKTRKMGYRIKGVLPGDQPLLLQIFREFSRIAQSDGFTQELIKKAFMQKRKMLRSSLTELYRKESVEECLSQLSLFKTARPQDLSLEAFIRLYESLSEASSRGP